MKVKLNEKEVAELDRQNPSTKSNGGFQGLLVGLQSRVDRLTGILDLTGRDIERIQRYAFDYRRGGWQGRLLRIFGRNLGPSLGRLRRAA
ncbi:MAG: aspartyl-tRNA synthetase [Vicinamibacterales bacterium]